MAHILQMCNDVYWGDMQRGNKNSHSNGTLGTINPQNYSCTCLGFYVKICTVYWLQFLSVAAERRGFPFYHMRYHGFPFSFCQASNMATRRATQLSRSVGWFELNYLNSNFVIRKCYTSNQVYLVLKVLLWNFALSLILFFRLMTFVLTACTVSCFINTPKLLLHRIMWSRSELKGSELQCS